MAVAIVTTAVVARFLAPADYAVVAAAGDRGGWRVGARPRPGGRERGRRRSGLGAVVLASATRRRRLDDGPTAPPLRTPARLVEPARHGERSHRQLGHRPAPRPVGAR